VAYIDSGTKELVIVQSSAASLTSYYMKATTEGSKTQFKEFKIHIAAADCSVALSVSSASVDQAYPKDATIAIDLSSTFGFANSDALNCAFATIKVFENDGTTELYSGAYSTGTYTFASSSQGTISYQIRAYGFKGIYAVDKGADGCTAANPCTIGEADCDADSDCAPGLKCFQRTGGSVPGVIGLDKINDAYDVCYDPLHTDNHQVSATFHIHICGAETASADDIIYFTTEQDSSGRLEVTEAQVSPFFSIENAIHADCAKV